ncbi:Kelch-like protein 25 [Folsomia candida]|uniref:Kelch-like protein 25 n=1 Tax=Folsomia candida TaxID=158441 RepID=A0A226DLE3_FOLCA|nr:Kelch-like protein 25 [Folsomia candida]
MGHPKKILASFLLILSFSSYFSPTSSADCSLLYATLCRARLPAHTQAPLVSYDGADSIYIFGGARWYLSGWEVYSNEILKYTISTDSIALVAHLPKGLYLGTVTADGLGNYFYFGGAAPNMEDSKSVYKFDSNTGQVTEVAIIRHDLQYSASFLYNSSVSYIQAGNLFQNGVIRFDHATNTWTRLTDLPTKFRTAAAFWDKNAERAYIFGQGNAAVNPPYDHVVYSPGPDIGAISNLQIPDDFVQMMSATNDEREGFIVGGFHPTDSIYWYQLPFDVGEYCPVAGLPGGGDVLFSRTGAAFVPKMRRVYVFGGGSQNLTSYLDKTHDEIWYIDV